jgi:integrase
VNEGKTRKSTRRIGLSIDVLEVLKEHRLKQSAEIKFLGDAWASTELMFPSEVGTPIWARNLQRSWTRLQKRTKTKWLTELQSSLDSNTLNEADRNHYVELKKKLEIGKVFPRIRLHDLRHLHASILIKAQKTPLEVAERLGHTKPSFTIDTYGHLFKEHQQEDSISILDLLPKLSNSN